MDALAEIREASERYDAAVALYGRDWMSDAPCSADPGGAFATGHAARVFVASFCARCEVRGTCLAFAVEAGIDHGIWGGIGKPADRRAAMARLDRD